MGADPAKLNVGNVKEEVTYTYLGRRDRGGKGEVVVTVNGVLRPMTGAATATCGSVEGQLVLEKCNTSTAGARIHLPAGHCAISIRQRLLHALMLGTAPGRCDTAKLVWAIAS